MEIDLPSAEEGIAKSHARRVSRLLADPDHSQWLPAMVKDLRFDGGLLDTKLEIYSETAAVAVFLLMKRLECALGDPTDIVSRGKRCYGWLGGRCPLRRSFIQS
jgi:hypothetical protein